MRADVVTHIHAADPVPAPSPSRYPLVMVRWEDSAQPRPAWEWIDDYELEQAILCVSVGYMVAENERAIALAPNLGDITQPRAQAMGIMLIPRSAIREMMPLPPPPVSSQDGE